MQSVYVRLQHMSGFILAMVVCGTSIVKIVPRDKDK